MGIGASNGQKDKKQKRKKLASGRAFVEAAGFPPDSSGPGREFTKVAGATGIQTSRRLPIDRDSIPPAAQGLVAAFKPGAQEGYRFPSRL